MKIAILLNESYPFGMACTNRIHLYAKGLLLNKNKIKIVVPRPTENSDRVRNVAVRGVHEEVPFQYASTLTERNNSFWNRRIDDSRAYIRTFFIICEFKPDVILIVGSKFRYTLLGKICAIITHSKLVREKSEVPLFKKKVLTSWQKLLLWIDFNLYDGLIVISKALKKFFRNELSFTSPILEVPILINYNEDVENRVFHEPVPVTSHKAIELVYSGSLDDSKDGILTIIEAFAIVSKNYPQAKLILTGDLTKSKDQNSILQLIQNLSLDENVVITGYLSIENLEKIRKNSSVLLLAKPANRQNQYNMATKVGEYLLTGRPTVISSIDPVCNYLHHRVDSFIVAPDKDLIANEIKFILENGSEAHRIGMRGHEVAISCFSYRKQAKRIHQFFKELLYEASVHR